jgi:endonuclease YncB( thermonuclease family)
VIKFKTSFVAAIILMPLLLAGCANSQLQLREVIDGDTLVLQDGRTIRLLQIDTPELTEGECYAQEAKLELVSILEASETRTASSFKGEAGNSALSIRKDSVSDDKDQYDRELRYLFYNNLHVNLELVKRGAAAPYFYQEVKGKYAAELLLAAEEAQANKVGLWGACVSAVLNPSAGISTGSSIDSDSQVLIVPGDGNCDPNYKGCIPPFPPDLDCGNIRAMGLAPVYRIGGDPHRLDRDGDGVGCE